jgi:hypothetical protein
LRFRRYFSGEHSSIFLPRFPSADSPNPAAVSGDFPDVGKIRKHAAEADLPISEIIPIADTVIVRPDPT